MLWSTKTELTHTHTVPHLHKEDELRPFDATHCHGDGGDVEGREVWGRGDVVMHGDLWRGGRGGSSQIIGTSVIHSGSLFACVKAIRAILCSHPYALLTVQFTYQAKYSLALADNEGTLQSWILV